MHPYAHPHHPKVLKHSHAPIFLKSTPTHTGVTV
jgi:hypothetical protein